MRRLISTITAVTLGLIALVPSSALAAGTTLSGRVYNAATGAAYGGVRLTLCGGQTVTTNVAGNWSATLPVGAAYCVRVTGGLPPGVGAPMTRNNPEVGTQTSYEDQLAGRNCYHDTSCGAVYAQWDRIYDSGLDFAYGIAAPAATATPAPAAVATPTPTPAATTPAVPAGFIAKFTKDIHLLHLSWQAAAGATSYQLDRSVDQTTWQTIGPKLTGTSYDDHGVEPGTHYYYRLQAVNAAGASAYATADLVSPDVAAPVVSAVSSPAAKVHAAASGRRADQWINYAVIAGAVLVVLLVVGLWPLRHRRRQSYLEYLRSKYYNL